MDRRATRRAATKAEILDAAWELVRQHGLAGLSLRDLGASVGMRAQSLYSYFDSKDAIYDAMFRRGVAEQIAWMEPVVQMDPGDDPLFFATAATRRFFEFCTADPARYQLLFQRTIPGFEPSPESYALAVEALDQAQRAMEAMGIDDPVASDLWTAVVTGLTSQQLANDPGGDRWGRLVDRAVRMLLRELAPDLLDDAPTDHQSRAEGNPR